MRGRSEAVPVIDSALAQTTIDQLAKVGRGMRGLSLTEVDSDFPRPSAGCGFDEADGFSLEALENGEV